MINKLNAPKESWGVEVDLRMGYALFDLKILRKISEMGVEDAQAFATPRKFRKAGRGVQKILNYVL